MSEEIVASDVPWLTKYLTEVNDKLAPVIDHVALLQQHFQSPDAILTEPGILFLKNELLTRYTVGVFGLISPGCLVVSLLCYAMPWVMWDTSYL